MTVAIPTTLPTDVRYGACLQRSDAASNKTCRNRLGIRPLTVSGTVAGWRAPSEIATADSSGEIAGVIETTHCEGIKRLRAVCTILESAASLVQNTRSK